MATRTFVPQPRRGGSGSSSNSGGINKWILMGGGAFLLIVGIAAFRPDPTEGIPHHSHAGACVVSRAWLCTNYKVIKLSHVLQR